MDLVTVKSRKGKYGQKNGLTGRRLAVPGNAYEQFSQLC